MQIAKTDPGGKRYLSQSRREFYGSRLKNIRKEKGLSPMRIFKELEYLGSMTQLKEYESGKSVMSGILMYRFCILYGKDIRTFFDPDYDGRFDSLSEGRDYLENEYILQKKLRTNIRKMREERGLSLSVMAEKAGICSATLCQYEYGKRVPMCCILCSICVAMDVSVFELFGPSEADLHKERRYRELSITPPIPPGTDEAC